MQFDNPPAAEGDFLADHQRTVLATLQRRDSLLKPIPRRVSRARILVTLSKFNQRNDTAENAFRKKLPSIVQFPLSAKKHLVDARSSLFESGRKGNGGDDGARDLVRILASVNGERAKAERFCARKRGNEVV